MTALTPDELSILYHIREDGPLTIEDLCDFTYTEKKDVSLHVNYLKDQGLIEYSKEDKMYRCVNFSEK